MEAEAAEEQVAGWGVAAAGEAGGCSRRVAQAGEGSGAVTAMAEEG